MEQSVNGYTPVRVYLQPIAAPIIVRLYGFAGAASILASHVAGWWDDSQSTSYI